MMKKRIRGMLLLLAVLTCITALCGCGGGGNPKTTEPPRESAGTSAASPAAATQAPPVGTLAEQRAKTQIGIWYSLWYDALPDRSFWDNEGTGRQIYYKPLQPDGSYSRYDSGSADVIQYHLQEMTDAGIDFLIFDQTNNIDTTNSRGAAWINVNSMKMAKAIWNWNKAGKKQIRYCSAIGAYATINHDYSIIESEAKKIWERYVSQKWGGEDSHVYVDGKPLLVLFTVTEEDWNAYKGDKTYTDKFTLRYSIGHAYDPGYWGWVMPKGTQVTEDVACIIPGWYKFFHPYEKVYRERGRTYRENWETLLRSETVPDFVVINSFNEYAEHTAVYTASTADFPADYPIEGWIDESGAPAPSLYWDLTKEYIAKYKNGEGGAL